MQETVTTNKRIYLVVEPGDAGRMILRLSLTPPALGTALAALIVRGLIMDGSVLDLELVSDPAADPDLAGPPGPNGWTPVLVPEADGTRTLIKVADWVASKGKPDVGYLTASGALASAKADAFNFNTVKRVGIFTGQTNSNGIATVVFDPPFSTVPATALPIGTPNVLAGPVKAEIVAGSLTKTGCQVKVTQQSLVGAVLAPLSGATAQVIAIEA
jgi:hypothetical protein